MFDIDIIFQQDVTYRFACGRFDYGAVRAQCMVGKNNDLGHLDYLESLSVNAQLLSLPTLHPQDEER